MKYTAGQVLGRYELLVPIAKGGMAQVWAARLRGTRGFQKIVAIKIIRAGTSDDARMEQMFLEEATIASQIHHPNVVGTMELGEHEGTLYLVMEWVEGESLSNLMTRASETGGLPLTVAVNLIAQACKGLQAAHDLRDESGALLGVVHRDISPQNVLVTYAGTAKLVDFGIAKVAARDAELTQEGELKGKFGYMAPEQVSGKNIDGRADIFSMGTLLYLLTTGRHPFQGDHPGATLQNICSGGMPTAPSLLVEGYPLELEAVVMKAVSKSPDDRWASAKELLAALETAVPQCHDGSFENRVAEYMIQLFGERSRERRAQLRAAQELADRLLPESHRTPSPTSVGSLRAVSVEGTPISSSGTLTSMRATVGDPFTQPSIQKTVRSGRRTRFALFAGGLSAGVVALVLSFAKSTAFRDVGHRVLASGSMSTVSSTPSTRAAAPSRPAPPAPSASSPPPPPPALSPEGGKEDASKSSRKAPAPTPAPPHAVAPAKPRPGGPPPGPAAPPPVERAGGSDGSNPSPWDRRF